MVKDKTEPINYNFFTNKKSQPFSWDLVVVKCIF